MSSPIRTMLIVFLTLATLMSIAALAYFGLKYRMHPAHAGGLQLELDVEIEADQMGGSSDEDILQTAAAILQRRLAYLITSVSVFTAPPSGLRIDMPEPQDLGRVTRVLEHPGVFTFHLVEGELDEPREALADRPAELAPEDLEIACYAEPNGTSCVTLQKQPIVTESDLVRVHLSSVAEGEPGLVFTLTEPAAQELQRVTSENVGKHLAIVNNGTLVATPQIQAPIGRRGVIGGFSLEEIYDLQAILQGPRLPAQVRVTASNPIDGAPLLHASRMQAGGAAIATLVFGVLGAIFMMVPGKSS